MTKTGVGILDVKRSVFTFESAGSHVGHGALQPRQLAERGRQARADHPAGLKIDLVQQNVLQSGEMAGLVKLRDKKLVQAQDQLDRSRGRSPSRCRPA